MREKILLGLGWLLIGTVGITWFLKGFNGSYIFLIYLSWLCFTSPHTIIKGFERIQSYSPKQLFLTIIGLLLSVAMALGIILACKYILENILHLNGVLKVIVQYIIVIIALIPSTLFFGKIVQYISRKTKGNRK